MGDPDIKVKRSASRKRNFTAKKMLETMPKRIHMSAKDREKQRQWRLKNDPDGDYTELDDWLTHTENF